jgi:cell wall-associated NlpC family hydrolase
MPAIRRMARSGALSLVSLGVVATGSLGVALTASPAHAADRDAVAMDQAHYQKFRKKEAARIKAAHKRESSRVQTALSVALNQRGDAYVYGANGPNAFDCSGLVQYSFGQAGINLPRTSGAQAGATRRIAKDDMQPGDLMFFYGSGGVYHAAIFMRWDNCRALMVHAPGSGQSVTVAAPWTSSWFAGRVA